MQRFSRYQPLPAYDSPENPDWLLLQAILVQWISEASKPVVVLPIPIYQFIEETAYSSACQTRFRELAQLTGVHVHDPLPDYHKVPKT